jgi:hypothetical protein
MKITIDLTDLEIELVRQHWTGPGITAATESIRAKVVAALPSAKIKPKAGGTCQAQLHSYWAQGVRTIRAVTDGHVWMSPPDETYSPAGIVVTLEGFLEQFEVLS